MPRPQKRRVRSNCWYFYSKTVDGGLCNMCKKEVRSTGNTTNLLNHLKRRHTAQYEEILTNPEKYGVNLDDDSHSDHGEDNSRCQSVQPASHDDTQAHSMEAFHADQGGGTVIWLQPTTDGQPNTFQPQITIVQQALPTNSETSEQNGEGETILSTGEIISSNHPPAENNGTTVVESPKPPADTRSKPPLKFAPRPPSKSSPCASQSVRSYKVVQPYAETVPREDTYDAFGRYVASLLRSLPSKKTSCRLQRDIIWLVLQEQIRNEDS